MDYAEKGDIGFIKFKNGEAYIIGFQKQKRADKYGENNC